MNSSRLRAFALSAIAVTAAACGGDSTPPRPSGPGVYDVALSGPDTNLGAARVQLVGNGIRSVQALQGRLFSDTRGDTTEVIVAREEGGELRFALSLADTTAVPRMTVLEVAGADNALLNVSAYRAEVVR